MAREPRKPGWPGLIQTLSNFRLAKVAILGYRRSPTETSRPQRYAEYGVNRVPGDPGCEAKGDFEAVQSNPEVTPHMTRGSDRRSVRAGAQCHRIVEDNPEGA